MDRRDAYRLAFWDGVRSIEWRMDLSDPGATYDERQGYADGQAFARRSEARRATS